MAAAMTLRTTIFRTARFQATEQGYPETQRRTITYLSRRVIETTANWNNELGALKGTPIDAADRDVELRLFLQDSHEQAHQLTCASAVTS